MAVGISRPDCVSPNPLVRHLRAVLFALVFRHGDHRAALVGGREFPAAGDFAAFERVLRRQYGTDAGARNSVGVTRRIAVPGLMSHGPLRTLKPRMFVTLGNEPEVEVATVSHEPVHDPLK